MKFKFYTGIISAVLLLNISLSSAASGKGDEKGSLNNSLSTGKIMMLKSSWSESQNAASLTDLNFTGKIAETYLGFSHENGEYRMFQDSRMMNRYGFYTDGFVKIGKWKFYGNFNYYNQLDKKVKWVDMMVPFEGNPYSVGDSVGGDYSKDFFLMEGKSALDLNHRLSVGFDVKYKAAVGTKRKDPRPTNTVTDFDFSPGVVWNFDRFKLGGYLKYETAKEDIVFESVTDRKFDLFYFRGLGTFSSTTEEDGRYTESNLYGGGLQFNFPGHSLNNLSSVSFSKCVTDLKRGVTYPLQVVLLENYRTDISSVFLFHPEQKEINRLQVYFSNQKSYGEEPVVEPKLEETSFQWSTAAKYTLYWHTSEEYGFNYAYYKTINPGCFDWGGTFSGRMVSDKTTYYFVPEFNRQKFNLLLLNATVEKGYQLHRNQFVVSLNGGFRKSFGCDLNMVSQEELLSKINLDFVYHDYNYAISRLWEMGLSLSAGREITLYKAPFRLFVKTGYKRLNAAFDNGSNRNIMFFNIGMNF